MKLNGDNLLVTTEKSVGINIDGSNVTKKGTNTTRYKV